MDMKLFKAAQNNVARGQMKSLREKIDANPDLLTYSNRETLLHTAVMSERLDMVQYLLDQGADPNATDNPYKLMTPLHYVSFDGPLDIIEALVEAGADVNAKDEVGRTPLFHALRSEKAFFYLLECGAKIYDPDWLFDLAAMEGSVNVIKYLLDEVLVNYPPANSDPAPGGGNGSALVWAVRMGRLEVVKLLLEHGAASGANGEDGQAALIEARQKNHGDIAGSLDRGRSLPRCGAHGSAHADAGRGDEIARNVFRGPGRPGGCPPAVRGDRRLCGQDVHRRNF